LSELNLIAISVGNSRTQFGQFAGTDLRQQQHLDNTDVPAIIQQVVHMRGQTDEPKTLMLASVNEAVAGQLDAALRDQLSTEIYHVGDDIPIPVGRQLDPETITGVDRLLNAWAAWGSIRQACIVIDAGTAITVDFVDGEGTFQGGAIMPGAAMQLQALHEQTAALPELRFNAPDKTDAFGRSTSQAMLKGVYHGIRGGIQRLVEQYAEQYGAFPQVIATGGDAEKLFEGDELIQTIVPDLTLRGIATAAQHALATDEAEGLDGRD
jgi:type III pantothenate kinase